MKIYSPPFHSVYTMGITVSLRSRQLFWLIFSTCFAKKRPNRWENNGGGGEKKEEVERTTLVFLLSSSPPPPPLPIICLTSVNPFRGYIPYFTKHKRTTHIKKHAATQASIAVKLFIRFNKIRCKEIFFTTGYKRARLPNTSVVYIITSRWL